MLITFSKRIKECITEALKEGSSLKTKMALDQVIRIAEDGLNTPDPAYRHQKLLEIEKMVDDILAIGQPKDKQKEEEVSGG